MGDFSFGEIIIIVVVGLVLFGPGKITEFARECGRAVNAFKKGLKEGLDDETPAANAAAQKSLPPSETAPKA
jgi:sec-independent protein translocase protein TatA